MRSFFAILLLAPSALAIPKFSGFPTGVTGTGFPVPTGSIPKRDADAAPLPVLEKRSWKPFPNGTTKGFAFPTGTGFSFPTGL